jgi:Uma2 family endonuclease
MTAPAIPSRRLEPGTTGWTVDDLENPEMERQWEGGAYELVEGVLAKMPPAYLDGSLPLQQVIRLIQSHLDRRQQAGYFAGEVDLILARNRIARPDAVFLTPTDLERQRQANARRGKKTLPYGRLLIAPTLVIESLSPGHETHDRDTKRQWYAEASVGNYWLLNPYDRSLECLILDAPAGVYRTDVAGSNQDELSPAAFPGLLLPLARLWLP